MLLRVPFHFCVEPIGYKNRSVIISNWQQNLSLISSRDRIAHSSRNTSTPIRQSVQQLPHRCHSCFMAATPIPAAGLVLQQAAWGPATRLLSQQVIYS